MCVGVVAAPLKGQSRIDRGGGAVNYDYVVVAHAQIVYGVGLNIQITFYVLPQNQVMGVNF